MLVRQTVESGRFAQLHLLFLRLRLSLHLSYPEFSDSSRE